MSRYSRLQELLKQEDSNIEKLSFYPDHLLNLRSILSEWVEKQDWSGVLFLSGESLTCRSQELLQEALKLLQDKLKNGNTSAIGFEFHIRNIETTLKKTYENQPQQFVEELYSCLTQEEQLLTTMSQNQTMCVDEAPVFQQLTLDELSCRIANCRELDKRVTSILNTAAQCLQQWGTDIQTRSQTPRDVFQNGKMTAPPFSIFQTLRQELDLMSQKVIQELNHILAGLQWFIVQWKTYQLHECVGRKVDDERPEMMEQVENMCVQVCACVNALLKCATSQQLQNVESVKIPSQASSTTPSIPTPSVISWFCLNLKDILKKIVEMLLVVQVQPPLTMMVEKEKGQKDKEDINNSKKFTTTVGILGGKGFEDNILINEVEIYLAFSRDLAEAQRSNRRPENMFKILIDRPDARGRRRSASPDSPALSYEKTYEELRVEHFSRKEVKHVYKQLYHVVYDLKIYIPLFVMEFKMQTISLPIIVRTGANQAAEHIGAQLWHSYSSPNVYNLKGGVAGQMKVTEVIDMMNQRIKFIDGVGLRDREQEFLRERLNMVASNGKGAKGSGEVSVSLDNFIKDKVCLPRHGAANGAKDPMDFSLWRWLHSIINLLEDPQILSQPWKDGIIFGFASRQQCIDALRESEDGTFLLRFSESFLPGNHIMAKGGLAAVIQRNGLADFAPPITSEDIKKEGLATMIANIGCQHLLGTQVTIKDLGERYPASKPAENPTTGRYAGWIKQERIVPSNGQYNGAVQSASCTSTTSKSRGQKKAKRPSQKTPASNSKQYRTAAPGSPDSISSSAPSPMPMSPDGRQHFQVVGLQEFPTQMNHWGEASQSPTNIPTIVTQMHGTSGVDQSLPFNTPGAIQQVTMVLERPHNEDIMDISSSTVSSANLVTSSPGFAQINSGLVTASPAFAQVNSSLVTASPTLAQINSSLATAAPTLVQINGGLNDASSNFLLENEDPNLNNDFLVQMDGDRTYNLEDLADYLQHNNISLPSE